MKMRFYPASDVKEIVDNIIGKLNMHYIKPDKVLCVRSKGTKSTVVHARCWSLPRIWQESLNVGAHYIIEVVGEKYDKLDEDQRKMLLIHELLHIPKTFSGALRPHKGYVEGNIVRELFKQLQKKE